MTAGAGDGHGASSPHRVSLVLRAMADADRDGAAAILDRVCVAAVSLLSLTGAGLSLMVDGELRGTAGVSDPKVAAVQELQLNLGEGPCIDAWAQTRPVLEPDLSRPAVARWPAFSSAGADAGALAVFAFPLHVGAIRIGVMVLYRDRAGGLDAEEFNRALVLADTATHVVLGLQAGAPLDALHQMLADEPPHWAAIHQATGILSVQLGAPLDEAFVRLRAYAFASDRRLGAVAEDVVAQRLRIGDPGT